MQIAVNGEPVQVPERVTLKELIDQLGLTGKRIAAEVNLEIVPRSEHEHHVLQSGDRIEIVHAIGGG